MAVSMDTTADLVAQRKRPADDYPDYEGDYLHICKYSRWADLDLQNSSYDKLLARLGEYQVINDEFYEILDHLYITFCDTPNNNRKIIFLAHFIELLTKNCIFKVNLETREGGWLLRFIKVYLHTLAHFEKTAYPTQFPGLMQGISMIHHHYFNELAKSDLGAQTTHTIKTWLQETQLIEQIEEYFPES